MEIALIEFSELVKRGSTAEDLGAGHAEAARVQGLGFLRAPHAREESSSLQPTQMGTAAGLEKTVVTDLPGRNAKEEEVEDEKNCKKRRREERRERQEERRERHEERRERRVKHEKYEKRHSRDSNDRKKQSRDKVRGRHDSD